MLQLPPLFLAALATMPVGYLWYSPLLFARPWIALNKLSAAKMKKEQTVFPFVVSFFSAFIMATIIAILLRELNIQTLQNAWKLGLLLWFAFDFLPCWMRHLFDKRPLELFMINVGHTAANVLVITWILMLWK